MRQWIRSALAQIMACRPFGAKPLSKPVLVIVNGTSRNKLQSNFNQNTKLFIDENASENIFCEMAAILSRGRWVQLSFPVASPSPSTSPPTCVYLWGHATALSPAQPSPSVYILQLYLGLSQNWPHLRLLHSPCIVLMAGDLHVAGAVQGTVKQSSVWCLSENFVWESAIIFMLDS